MLFFLVILRGETRRVSRINRPPGTRLRFHHAGSAHTGDGLAGLIERLLAALPDLKAKVLDLAGRSLPVDANTLLGSGQCLLRTRAGRLDVRGTLHDGRGYAELLEHTDTTRFGEHDIRVVDLPTLIEIKSTTGRAHDRLVVPILLELARKRGVAPNE